jgi:heptosyltransferase-2
LPAARAKAAGTESGTPIRAQPLLPIGHTTSRPGPPPPRGHILIVAPSWVGDAILSEPLVARLSSRAETARIDVLAPAWCAPVYARMRGIGRIFDSTLRHGEVNWAQRRALARTLSAQGYVRSIVLPNSWKSALVPWLARIPCRTGYVGEMRWGIINDSRRLDAKALPRLVDRYTALAVGPREAVPPATAPVLVHDAKNRDAAVRALRLDLDRDIAILCPGAEFGPAKRWPAAHFADLARKFLAAGMHVWILGSPNDQGAAAAVLAATGDARGAIRDLSGRTDLGTAIDLLSLATIGVCNDSGLMHAAASVGAPLVALFGSSSPAYTPPMSTAARIARIEIACSPCFKRECPLGHFKCMRDLTPDAVYDLARASLRSRDTVEDSRPVN